MFRSLLCALLRVFVWSCVTCTAGFVKGTPLIPVPRRSFNYYKYMIQPNPH